MRSRICIGAWAAGAGLSLAAAMPSVAMAPGWGVPSACPGDTDTAKVQYALEHFQHVRLDRSYEVTSVVIAGVNRVIDFQGHALSGVDESPEAEAVLFIRGRALTLRDVRVNANYRYRAAVRWHSLRSGDPAQYIKVFGMHIAKARVGILFGAFDDPVDAPQSENAITGLTFRCVQTCLHLNQPNGFLYIANSVLDCNPFEWKLERPGEFDDAGARIIHLERGHLEVANSELLKTSTQQGHMAEIRRGTLKLANCHFESGAAAFLLQGGSLQAANLSGLINNDSVPVLDLAAGAEGGLSMLVNCHFRRMLAVSRYSGMAAFRGVPGTSPRVILTNGILDGWRPDRVASPAEMVSALQVLCRFVDAAGATNEHFMPQ